MGRKLPSLHALRMFEVAGRHQNFTRAANELRLSQGAVSYQIRTLEADLGFPLFRRIGRSVVLSPQGSSLWPVLHSGFNQFVDAIERLRQEVRQHPREVVVAATTYFASRWLLRRLAHFMTEHPDIGVRLPYAPAFGQNAADVYLEIKWGDERWPAVRAIRLFDTELMGLCAPTLLRGKARPVSVDDIRDIPHLYDDGAKEAEAWRRWLEAAGMREPRLPAGAAIVDPNVRMQAAVDGQGIVLADRLVQDELQSGRLVAPLDVTLAGYSYYLIIHDPSKLSEQDNLFVEWLQREAAHPF